MITVRAGIQTDREKALVERNRLITAAVYTARDTLRSSLDAEAHGEHVRSSDIRCMAAEGLDELALTMRAWATKGAEGYVALAQKIRSGSVHTIEEFDSEAGKIRKVADIGRMARPGGQEESRETTADGGVVGGRRRPVGLSGRTEDAIEMY